MKITENLKIRGLTPELSEQVQKICIAQGITKNTIQSCSECYTQSITILPFNKSFVTHPLHNIVNENKEISPAEFIRLYGEPEGTMETNALRELLVKADSAMQNKNYEEVISAISAIWRPIKKEWSNETRKKCVAIDEKLDMSSRLQKESHELILEMLNDTYPEEDRIRPTKR